MRKDVLLAIAIVSLFVTVDLAGMVGGIAGSDVGPGPVSGQERAVAGYYILAGVKEADGFSDAVDALVDFRGGEVIRFDPLKLDALKDVLKTKSIRYAAVVVRPEDLHANFSRSFLMMSTNLDDDVFSDFSYGFITGSTPQEAVNFVNNIKRAEKEGVPDKALDIAGWAAVENWKSEVDTTDDQYSYVKDLSPKSHSELYLEVNDTGAGRDFFFGNTDYLKDNKLLYIGFNGDPHMLWLFDGGNFDPNPPIWDFDPAKVEDPANARMGLTSHNISTVDMYPAVAMNGACHSGVMKTALVQGDIKATFGNPKGVSKYYSMSDDFSFAASILRNNVTGYFAPVGANHGSDADDDRYNAFRYDEPLGDTHKRSVDQVVMGFLGNRPNLVLFEDGGPGFPEVKKSGTYDPKDWDDGLTMMLSGKANRIYFGDPLYDPFKKDRSPALNLTKVRFDKKNESTLDINISFDKPAMMSFPIWDKLHVDGYTTNGYKIYVPVGLPDDFKDTNELRLVSASGTYTRAIKAIERFDGHTIAHLELDVPSEYSPTFTNRLQFNMTLRATRPIRYGVDILGPDLEGTILPGGTLVSNLSMRNTGDVQDDIIVKVSNVKDLPAGWGANLSYDGSSMAPMAERGIVLSVKAPSNARGEEKVTVRLSASSGASQSVSDNITLNVTVGITRGVRLACPICNGTADPGKPVDYDLLVMNSGNSKDNISLSVGTGTIEGWKTELVFDGTNMAMGGTRTGTLTIRPPSDAMNGSVMSLVVQATSLSKPDISSQVTLVTTVGPVFKVGISVPVPEMGARPGEQVPFPFTIQNSGNAIDEYALEISEPTDGWNAVVQFEKGPMASGGNRSGTLVVTPSESETADSLATIDMVVSSIHDGGINATASFTARVLPVHGLYIVEDDGVTSPPETAPGDEALFRFQVLNTGNADDNVTLEAVSSNGWPVRISEWFQGTELHPDESVTMKVLLDVPSDAGVGEVAVVTLTGRSGSDRSVVVSGSGQTKVAAYHRFSLLPDEQNAIVEAGSPVRFNLSVSNEGNGDWQFTIDVTGEPSAAASSSERTFTLPKGGSRTVAVDIAPSLTVGDHVFTVKVTEGNVTRTASLRVSVLAKTEGTEDGGDAGRGSSALDWSTWGMLILLLLMALVILVGVFARIRFDKMPPKDIARSPAAEKGDVKRDAEEEPKETHDLGPPVSDGETEFVELTDDLTEGQEGGWG